MPKTEWTEPQLQIAERLSRVEKKLDWLIERARELAAEQNIKLPPPPR